MTKQDKNSRGVGRPPSPYPETIMKVRFKSAAERKAYMEILPRKRVELALRARHILLDMPTCAGVWLYYDDDFQVPKPIDVFEEYSLSGEPTGEFLALNLHGPNAYCDELPGAWWGPVPEVPKEMAEANSLTIGERL